MKNLLSVSAGVLGVGILLAPLAFAAESQQDTFNPPGTHYYERERGTFACRNSLDPQCKNPTRDIGEAKKGTWACRNNPGPACTNPPRIDRDLAKGTWVCRNNQNTPACGNPLRYSIPDWDHDNWPTYFTHETATTMTTPR